MPLEIERRFLVSGENWREFAGPPKLFRQGYLNSSEIGFTIRVRIVADDQAWLTIKAPAEAYASHEFEYPIPVQEAEQILDLTSYKLRKTRYKLSISGGDWVVDCFEGSNKSLVLAEVELSSLEQQINIPSWCSKEITGQFQWSNASLAKYPVCDWPPSQQNQLG